MVWPILRSARLVVVEVKSNLRFSFLIFLCERYFVAVGGVCIDHACAIGGFDLMLLCSNYGFWD